MMKRYNKADALHFILERACLEEYSSIVQEALSALIKKCIEADFNYMIAYDVYKADGSRGECYYNLRAARQHIQRMLIEDQRALLNQHPTDVLLNDFFRLVDDYLDFNLSYLEHIGITYPVDEAHEIMN